MKVLLLFTSSGIGGAERSLTKMTLAESSATCEYTLASLGDDSSWAAWARSVGVEPHSLGWRRPGRRSLPLACLRLAKLWRQSRPDILYVVGLSAAAIVRLLRPFMPRCKVVHGIRSNLALGTPEASRYRPVEKLLWRSTDRYICNSAVSRDSLVELLGGNRRKIDVIYNGVNSKVSETRDYLTRPLEICLVANLAPRKGHLPFLDVIAEVRKSHPDVLFRFIGEDKMNGRLQEAVAETGLDEAVSFEGYQPNPERFVANSRILVLPSLYSEGCPTSILEAFLVGTPVVAYNIDGIPELVEEGVDGLLAPLGDRAQLADHLLWLLENPEKANQMGRAGQQKVTTKFSMAACAERHRISWQELLNRR